VLWERSLNQGLPRMVVSPPNFADWRSQTHSFQDLAACRQSDFTLVSNGEPVQVRGSRVSATLFSLLGVQPALGRNFQADEDQPGKPAAVIISESLWHRRFAGSASVIGQASISAVNPQLSSGDAG
jgi:hypothetical protein